MNELENKIINAISQEADVDRSEIVLDSKLYDLGIDSLSALELLSSVEDKFDIRISEQNLRNTSSVREIIEAISKSIEGKQRNETG